MSQAPVAEAFKPGLEGVIAFETEIAEPDKEGGSLRYRGVDIEELVGHVSFGHVWGLLVDDAFAPGLPSAEHQGSLDVRTTDTGHAWHVAAEDGRIQARREPAGSGSGSPAQASVAGPASGLYLFLWNRSDAGQAGVTIAGDPGFLTLWQSSVRVRWG